MNENWLRQSQLHHLVYTLHLMGWLGIAGAVLVHVGSGLQRGGPPLLGSMLSLRCRPDDRPPDWARQILRYFTSRPSR